MPMSDRHISQHFETLAIHAGNTADPLTGAVVPPIYQVSTYKQDGVGGLRGGYEYSRSANPTRTALEGALAAVEEGERGFAFASGLAAEDTILRALTKPGDHCVIPDDAYGGTFRLFDKVARPWGLEHTAAAVSDLDAVRTAVTGPLRSATGRSRHTRNASRPPPAAGSGWSPTPAARRRRPGRRR